MEKKKSFFERRPYVCYALYAGLLFAFNLFSALVERRVGCGRVSYVSHQYPYIDSWFCVG